MHIIAGLLGAPQIIRTQLDSELPDEQLDFLRNLRSTLSSPKQNGTWD